MEGGGEGTGSVAPARDLRRAIGFWGGVAVLVGSTIGSGIFRSPQGIALQIQDPAWILGLWVGFGLVSLCGALTLAELATMMPQTGGTYVYLRAAYGDAAAFVFGWLYLLAAIPSGMGALGAAFGETLAGSFYAGKPPAAFVPLVAVAAVVILSVVNILGVRFGSAVQSFFTVVKIGAILAVIGAVLCFGRPGTPAGDASGLKFNLPAAATLVIFTYNGWVYVGLVAGEVEAAEHRLRNIILVGILAVIALYVGANAAYLRFMSPADMALSSDPMVPRVIMGRLFGTGGAALMGACILASIFGSLNGVILTKSRVAYALARDGLSFPALGRCHPRWATPYVSILVQGAVAVALIAWLRSFTALTAYFVVVEWFALLFAIGAVFVLRRTQPDAPRPYRTPGYPWVPLVFIVGTAASLGAIVWGKGSVGEWQPVIGLGIALAGFPVYWIWRRTVR